MWRLLRGKKRQDRTTEGAYRRDDALAATARAYRATPEPAAEEATAGGGDADRPVERSPRDRSVGVASARDRKSTRLNSSHVAISYADFCLKTKSTTDQ